MTVPPPFLAGRALTATALDWATARHGDQVRDLDRASFILHPLEVAALLSGAGFDDEVVAAGLLHDVVEDTDAELAELMPEFGPRVCHIVAAVTEDASIEDYERRKAGLRAQVAAAGPDAAAVYAADKVVKARELRAEATHAEGALEDPGLRRRLEHYEASLDMLVGVADELPLVRQLAFELWALRNHPPQPPSTR